MVRRIVAFAVFVFVAFQGLSQKNKTTTPTLPIDSFRGENAIRAMFYNCENLMDWIDDSLTRDDDFTPEGSYHWTQSKFYDKLNKIAKAIVYVGGWEPPEIVGLCEVENLKVLKLLVSASALKSVGYRIVHYESPDPRGIDVALLYRPEKIKLLKSQPLKAVMKTDSGFRSRDILMAQVLVMHQDTLNVFINHWPSRLGGQSASNERRLAVATIVKERCDSIFSRNPFANILIMGDFNDEPTDISILKGLQAKPDTCKSVQNSSLVNIAFSVKMSKQGSYFIKNTVGFQWDLIDQIIVSGALYNGKSGLKIHDSGMQICRASFLFKENEEGQMQTWRTNSGPRYLGGFSDHLPVFVDIIRLK